MNLIDLLLIGIVLCCMYIGYYKGFIKGIIQLFMLAAGLLSAFFLYSYFAAFLGKKVPSLGIWTVPVSFIAALFIARIILSFIAGHLLSSIPEKAHINFANRITGVIPGAINGSIWAIVAGTFLLSVPFSDHVSQMGRDSKLAGRMADQVDLLNSKLSPFIDEVVNKPLGKVTLTENAEQAVRLPFKDRDPKVREDLEAKMLVLVNDEREKAGLNPLKFDIEMLPVAREHSADMFARGYFAHETPEGLSPFTE